MIHSAGKEGEHGAIHTRTIERPVCGAWADTGTVCGADPQFKQLIAAHLDEDEFCRHVIQRDINGVGSG